jgi:hypothetical protein
LAGGKSRCRCDISIDSCAQSIGIMDFRSCFLE